MAEDCLQPGFAERLLWRKQTFAKGKLGFPDRPKAVVRFDRSSNSAIIQILGQNSQ